MKFIKRWWIAFIFIFMFELLIPKGYIKTEIIIKDRKTGRIIYRSIKIELDNKNNFEKDTIIKKNGYFIDPKTRLWNLGKVSK